MTAKTAAERRLGAQHAVALALADSPALSDATPRILREISEYLRTVFAVESGSGGEVELLPLEGEPSSMLKERNSLISGAVRAERRTFKPTSWQGKRE